MDLAPKCYYLNWLVVDHFSSFSVHCLHSHVLYFPLYCLCKGYFVIVAITCCNWRNLCWFQLPNLGQIEHDGGTDQLSVDILNAVGAECAITEVLIAIFIISADKWGEGEFCLGWVEKLVLNESFISWFGLGGLYLIGTKCSFNWHKSSIILRTSNFEIDGSGLFNLDDEILTKLVSHLFFNLEIFIDKLIII